MQYTEFRQAANRKDKAANDNVHYFSRLLAMPTAYVLYRLRLSPNQATFLFGAVGLLAGISFWTGLLVAGWLLWRAHIVIDMADGSIARATKVFSNFADGYDKSIHIIVNTTVLLALAYSGGIYSTNLLLVAFYLYYLQNKIFASASSGVVHFSLPKNVLKDCVSQEGFIVVSIVLALLSEQNGQYQLFANLVYSSFFTILFVMKVARMVRGANAGG